MVANIDPIYIKAPYIQVGGAIIGNTAQTETSGANVNGVYQIYNSVAPDGSFVYKVILKSVYNTPATVARLYFCGNTALPYIAGQTNDAANTALLAELTLAAWTVSQTSASPQYEIPVNFPMQANTKLLMSFGTNSVTTNSGFNPIVIAGQY